MTDLNLPYNGVREYTTEKGKWTMIVQGKVGFLLDEELTDRWRVGGAKVVMVGSTTSNLTRVVMVSLPGCGRGRGLSLVASYAPTSKQSEAGEREKHKTQLTMLLEKVPGNNICVIGGDFNAEVGATKDRVHQDVLGPHGDNNRNRTGEELMSSVDRRG